MNTMSSLRIGRILISSTIFFWINFINAQITPGSPSNFISIWNTENSTSLSIPTGSLTLNYDLYWEEVGNPTNNGMLTNQTGSVNIPGLSEETEYRIEVSGLFRIFINNAVAVRTKIREIMQWGTVVWQQTPSAFRGCSNLEISASDVPDLSIATNMEFMFSFCTSMSGTSANWNWNTSNIQNMSNLFDNCTVFNGDISTWITDNVTIMSRMFQNATSFNQPLGSWNTENVTTFNRMFLNAESFNQSIENWQTGSATNMESMFNNVPNYNHPMNNWDVSNVTTMREMFRGAAAFNQPLGNWLITSLTNMQGMFQSASSFNQDLNSWNTLSVTNMISVFQQASSFNGNITDWNVSNVTDFTSMFNGASTFNQDISSWILNSAINTSFMFSGALVFNQPIGNWHMDNVTNIASMFSNTQDFNQDLSNWNTSSVINMSNVFQWTGSFNQDISNWDVSNVQFMVSMFRQAQMYNHNIVAWNTQNVQSMGGMFWQAVSFDQDLSGLNISNVSNMINFLSESGMSCENYSQTLISWASNPQTPSGILMGADGLFYNSHADQARTDLLLMNGWTIVDDQLTNQMPEFAFDNAIQICSGESIFSLPATSDDGYTGTWSPAVIDNTVSQNYVFTPDIEFCLIPFVLQVSVTEYPVLDNVEDVVHCGGYELPELTNGGYFSQSGQQGQFFYPGVVINSSTTLFVYAENLNCSVEESFSITINELPSAAVNQGSSSLVAGEIGATYQWLDCNDNLSPISNETNQAYSPTQPGSYAVEVSNENCTVISDCIEWTLGLTPELSTNLIKVYPTPFETSLFVEIKEFPKAIKVLDMQGKLVLEVSLEQEVNHIDLPIASGIYNLVIDGDTRKIIKM
jgi:surface protein